MISEQVSVLHAVKQLCNERGNIALHNESFQEQLVAFARYHKLLGPKPGMKGSLVQAEPPPSFLKSIKYNVFAESE